MTPGATSYQRLPALGMAILALLLLPPVAPLAGTATGDAAPTAVADRDDEQLPDGGEPPRIVEEITVTATRLPVRPAEVPASTRAWSGEAIRRAPALTLDGALEQSPQFSLFRRTSSLTAHPTSQGVNLRGVAPSGVSRALVLVDGTPLNDPFGGWVYWDRIPELAIERVELALGGGSAPYGSQALSGVVQVVTRAPVPTFRIDALGGERATARAGFAVGDSDDGGGYLAAAQLFHTDGYVAVAPDLRGPVDTPVASRHGAVRLRLDRGGWRATVDALHERRDNGTPERTNRTTSWGGSVAWSPDSSHEDPGAARWALRGYARRQSFHSTFSAVGPERRSELPVLAQEVPSTDLGAAVRSWWWFEGGHVLSLGGDWRRVAGASRERILVTGARRCPGGSQQLGGAWASLDWSPGAGTRVVLSLRADAWRNAPDQPEEPLTSQLTFSPRAGIVWHPLDGLTLQGSAYRSFRAPTLNELYRRFRVGDVVTRANPRLDAEHLVGTEGGARWSVAVPGIGRLALGATAFWNRVDEAIVNATLDPAEPNLRQRLNAGTATIAGVEVDGRMAVGDRWSLRISGALLDARLSRDVAGPRGPDPRLPQVPEYRATAAARYSRPDGLRAVLLTRAVGMQFEDDRNLLPLSPGLTIDAAVTLPLRPGLQLELRGENLLDRRIEVGRTPVLLLGPPRMLYGGVTMTLPFSDALEADDATTVGPVPSPPPFREAR